jgi:hypothetical protein
MTERAEHQGIPVNVYGRRFHAAGSYRHGVLPTTETRDREAAPVLIGSWAEAPTAYLAKAGGATVVLLGFDDADAARVAFESRYRRAATGMVQMPVGELRERLAKSDYERVDPRTGKIEHVHDSRVRHVLTTQGEARMAAFRMSRETDWTRPASEIVRDKTLAPKIAALRVDPRGEFPDAEPGSTKKSAAAFSSVGDFLKSLDLTRRPTQGGPDPLIKAFEAEYPQVAALTRRVVCDCQPGSGDACSCSVTYGGAATNPMKGVQTVKKSGYPETDLMRSMRGASTTQPARFSVRIVQEHSFGRANSERTAWVNKSQVVDAITKSFTSGDAVVQPSDLALLDRGIVRAAVADRLKIGVSSDQGSAPLRKAEADDPLKRAAAWLDALADEEARR